MPSGCGGVPFNVSVPEVALPFEGSVRLFRVEEAVLVDGKVTDHLKPKNFAVFAESISLQS